MSEVTQLLQRWQNGNPDALDALIPLVYNELRIIARTRMRAERDYQTLEPTALLHEAFLLLRDQDHSTFRNRSQFFALAAHIMRRILIDHARRKQAEKRGGDRRPVSMQEAENTQYKPWMNPLLLDDALTHLATTDTHLHDIAELKLFGGFDMQEIATILDLALATTYRHWKMAKAHLYNYFREAR